MSHRREKLCSRAPVRWNVSPEDFEPGRTRFGWQHEASSRTELQFRGRVMATLAQHEQALLLSQSGPLAGTPLSTTPSKRLRPPLLLSSRQCRCGRPSDLFGHHRAACSRAGVLGRRGSAVERVAARICRERGARVATNFMVRDMDLRAPNVHDGRRLEVVADGLPLPGGAQLAVNTTLVPPVAL